MGREIRRVPPNWEHPKDRKWTPRGIEEPYIPLREKCFEEAAAEWKEGYAAWERGERPAYAKDNTGEFWEWQGGPPRREEHVTYCVDEATWFQMYETVSEGTPVTPPFETQGELVEHLVQHGAYWDNTPWRREAAESFVADGSAPSFMVVNNTVFEGGRDADLIDAALGSKS